MSTYRNYIRLSVFAVVAVLGGIAYNGTGYCNAESEIVHWVAGQMEIQKAHSVPVVKTVDKAALNKIFASGSAHVMARWVADHGQAGADKLMRVYLESAVGLFDPKTRTIYVGSFLSPCRRKAILAHEIAHYFQYMFRGPITGDDMAAEMILMEREIEACAIERRFEERFCGETEIPFYTAASSSTEPLYFP